MNFQMMTHANEPENTLRRAFLAAMVSGALTQQTSSAWAAEGGALHFGILPIGGTVDSRVSWEPLLASLSDMVGRTITILSVTAYSMLGDAVKRGEVDIAFLSGKMALDAVTLYDMSVVAQVSRHDGQPGYRALLLSRADGPVRDLEAVLAEPGRWRLARGEKRSMSGYIIPKQQLFMPRRIDIETAFKGDIEGTHQRTALAVANGEADIATNNTADFERFSSQFPSERKRLRVLWESDLIPHGVIVMRRRAGDRELRQAAKQFFVQYGRGAGPKAEEQRAALKQLHDLAGFLAADDRALLPVAHLTHQLELESARSAQWINDAALQARIKRIETQYASQLKILTAE